MSNTNQLWEYAADAMVSAYQAKNLREKSALLDLARIWSQAAVESERIVIAGATPIQDSERVTISGVRLE